MRLGNYQSEAALRVSARMFTIVAPFRAQRDIRYYLVGVLVRPHPAGGVLLAATNGHQLALAYDKTGATDRERILNVSNGLITAARHKRASFVEGEGDRLLVKDDHGAETFIQPGKAEIEAKYPDVLKVIPKSIDELQPGAVGHVCADYLARACAVAKRLDDRYVTITHWSLKGNGDGVIIHRYPADQNVIVVTMPQRGDYRDAVKPLPEFVNAARAA